MEKGFGGGFWGALVCFVGFPGGFLLFFEQYFYTFEFGKISKS